MIAEGQHWRGKGLSGKGDGVEEGEIRRWEKGLTKTDDV